jgi:aminoglycoside phosphotransferase (APT) family kinase protein
MPLAEMPDDLAGLRAGPVTEWLAGCLPGLVPPLDFRRLAGGNSNLTYRVTDRTGRSWVLRRPPAGAVLATAHDVLREARVLAALGGAGLPVPRIDASCADPEVTGAPFVVMEFVDGLVCLGSADAGRLAPAQRQRAGESLATTLGALHRADPDRIGLGDLGRHTGYLERQLARWHTQWRTGRLRDLPAIDSAADLLRRRIPAQARVAVVHGDYRLDNCVLAPDGSVRAVLDWEICALGDPLADLGVLLAYWAEPGDEVRALQDPPTAVPGFPDRARMRSGYLAAAGYAEDVDVSFYLAFAWWKLACIVEGVYARTVRRGTPAGGRDAASYASQAERLAGQALWLARSLPGP